MKVPAEKVKIPAEKVKVKVSDEKVKVPAGKVKVKVPAEKHEKHAKAEPFFPALLNAILIIRLESAINALIRPVPNSQTGN